MISKHILKSLTLIKNAFLRNPVDWGQLQFALEGLDSQMPNDGPKSSIQDLHEDKKGSKWGLMEEEKLQSSPGEGNNKKMFPLANEDSNFFWPDTTDLFNLDSPRLQAEHLPTPITGFENHYKSIILSKRRYLN